jgi:hypothetical protein
MLNTNKISTPTPVLCAPHPSLTCVDPGASGLVRRCNPSLSLSLSLSLSPSLFFFSLPLSPRTDCLVTAEGACTLATGLAGNQTLTHLNLDHNVIGAIGAQALSRVVRSHAALRVLSLAHNRLGDLGVVVLVEAIGHPACPVRVMTLAGNTINDTGLQALASVWTTGSLLQELDLRDNLIGNLSVSALTHVFHTHSGAVALQRIWMSGNPCITDRDIIDALYDAVKATDIDPLCLGLH